MYAPSLRVMNIIANSDMYLFEHLMYQEGLVIVGTQNDDPLNPRIKNEAVVAIASTLTESIHDQVEMTKRQKNLKRLAEDRGYVVAVEEGLDQQSGTDYNPIKGQLRHPTKQPPAQPPQDEEAEGEEVPPPV